MIHLFDNYKEFCKFTGKIKYKDDTDNSYSKFWFSTSTLSFCKMNIKRNCKTGCSFYNSGETILDHSRKAKLERILNGI